MLVVLARKGFENRRDLAVPQKTQDEFENLLAWDSQELGVRSLHALFVGHGAATSRYVEDGYALSLGLDFFQDVTNQPRHVICVNELNLV